MDHITVCICTFKRPKLLARLLHELGRQETAQLLTYEAVVVDNDHLQSAKPIVAEAVATRRIAVQYCVEGRQNIALARNLALTHAHGNLIAFFDDDQFPPENWLLTLYQALQRHHVAGVLGPVKPFFETQPPSWVIKGKFCERATYPTGSVINWRMGRTGNVLLKRFLFNDLDQPFRPEFVTGEDQDFFRRMIESGHKFIWCDEAVAYEAVSPNRWSLKFMLRRALLRGKVSIRHRTGQVCAVAQSMIALPLYVVSLPFLLLFGYHQFIKYLIKIFDHAGRILSVLGINPSDEIYVAD